MSPDSSYPVSPPQQRCVWMSGGVLAYQLCFNDFNCSDCPLDKAMQNLLQESDESGGTSMHLPIHPIRPGRYYTQEHCWISVYTAESVHVGIEPNLASRCTGLIGVSLPGVGRSLAPRTPAAWCRFDRAMIPVRLPFGLEVDEVNKDLLSRPDLMVTDPYDEGWLFSARVDPRDLEESGVMASWTAENVYRNDEQKFIRQIRDIGGRSHNEAGVTAYDGGTIVPESMRILGTIRYCAILSEVYCKT